VDTVTPPSGPGERLRQGTALGYSATLSRIASGDPGEIEQVQDRRGFDRAAVAKSAVQSCTPETAFALAVNASKLVPDFSRVLRARMLTSCPWAALRNVPTVACDYGTCWNGSKEYQRMAFSWVILLMSSSETLYCPNVAWSCSGAFGHIESECG
jgi:hypothetical protein